MEEKEIALSFCPPKINFTVGDIISCKAFCYGIYLKDKENEIAIFRSEGNYQNFLLQYTKDKTGTDAYDPSRGEAWFLVVSMEIAEVTFPNDVEEDTRYLGVNVKCIRLATEYSLCRDAERIFFTLYHPMSCLDLKEENPEIIRHLDLPVYWKQKNSKEEGEGMEKPF